MKSFLPFFFIMCCFACKNETSGKGELILKEEKNKIKKEFTFENKPDSIVTNGEQILYHKNGVMEMRGRMKAGKRDGLWKSWYDTGLPWSETTFKDGKKSGRTTTWYDNGNKRYEGFFNDDKESGRWIFWTENGTVSDTKNYDLK